MLKENVFNKEIKEWYIKSLDVKENSLITYLSLFNKATLLENQKNKDIFDMHKVELEELFYSLKSPSPQSISASIGFIARYIDWAIMNGYTDNRSQRLPSIIDMEYCSKFVYKASIVRYTREQLLTYMNAFDDQRHAVFLLCLFEGIKGEGYSEILNLKMEDLMNGNGFYFAKLTNSKGYSREIEISEDLYWRLERLDKVSSTSLQPKQGQKYFSDSTYIFKKANAKGEDIQLRASFGNRALDLAKSIFDNSNLIASTMQVSGMMWYIWELLKHKEAKVLNKEILEKVASKYDTGYVNKDSKYVSYSILQHKLDFDFMKTNYGFFYIEL
ncbi:phage lytic cycle repressor MrpR family protein [Lysinibacillus sphaericus]|uniref:phage lytic cycle repressor MrpR family protein n=1 Tax=Lysinibacillus sphaericus TaxID=1421 RepID=UPI001CBC70E7|nr:site-specific integrase [Lysinibacillus sphaericus]